MKQFHKLSKKLQDIDLSNLIAEDTHAYVIINFNPSEPLQCVTTK